MRVWYPRPYERRKLASVTLVERVHARGGAPPSSEEAIAAGRAVGRLRKGEGELAAAIGGDGAHCWGGEVVAQVVGDRVEDVWWRWRWWW